MAAGITAEQIYQLNRMNSTANKVQLGTLIQNAESPAGNINIPSAKMLVGDGSGIGQAVTMSGDVTNNNTGVQAIGAGKVLKAMLGVGVRPSHIPVFAGTRTTLGGSATEAFTVTGALATDVVSAVLRQKGGTPRTLLTLIPSADTLTQVFSGDPSTDHIVDYVVFRATT